VADQGAVHSAGLAEDEPCLAIGPRELLADVPPVRPRLSTENDVPHAKDMGVAFRATKRFSPDPLTDVARAMARGS